MVKYSEEQIDSLFQSLSDPTRRDILLRTSQKELDVTEIASHYKISLPAISKHLKVLGKADLVVNRKKGRERYYRANPKAILEVQRYIDYYTKYWNDRFDNLESYLSEENLKKEVKKDE